MLQLWRTGGPADGVSFLTADTILPPGKRIVRVHQPCSVRCESDTGTYIEFCGLPQKSSSSSNGSDSDNNRERHILKTLKHSWQYDWNTTVSPFSGSVVKGETTHMSRYDKKKANLSHPNSSINHQMWLCQTGLHLLSPKAATGQKDLLIVE